MNRYGASSGIEADGSAKRQSSGENKCDSEI